MRVPCRIDVIVHAASQALKYFSSSYVWQSSGVRVAFFLSRQTTADQWQDFFVLQFLFGGAFKAGVCVRLPVVRGTCREPRRENDEEDVEQYRRVHF